MAIVTVVNSEGRIVDQFVASDWYEIEALVAPVGCTVSIQMVR